jgi:hypothetical protein
LAGHRRCGEQTRHSLGSGGSRPGKWVPTQQQGKQKIRARRDEAGKEEKKKKYFTKYIKTSIVAVTFNPVSNGVPMATFTTMYQNLQRGPPTGWMLPQIGFGILDGRGEKKTQKKKWGDGFALLRFVRSGWFA